MNKKINENTTIYLDMDGVLADFFEALARFYNVDHWKENVGFFGFFECVNNQEVANALFDSAIKWLKEKGVDGVYGTCRINF
mgnify:CR=1 FL=1